MLTRTDCFAIPSLIRPRTTVRSIIRRRYQWRLFAEILIEEFFHAPPRIPQHIAPPEIVDLTRVERHLERLAQFLQGIDYGQRLPQSDVCIVGPLQNHERTRQLT